MIKYRIEETISNSGSSRFIIQKEHGWIFTYWMDALRYTDGDSSRVMFSTLAKASKRLKDLKNEAVKETKHHY